MSHTNFTILQYFFQYDDVSASEYRLRMRIALDTAKIILNINNTVDSRQQTQLLHLLSGRKQASLSAGGTV